MPFDGNPQDYTRVAPVYDRDNPPTRMSEAIRMAVADIEAQERAGIEYDWSDCSVCTAGAVCRRVGIKWIETTSEWEVVLDALSQITEPYGLANGQYLRTTSRCYSELFANRYLDRAEPISSYSLDPIAFKRDMLALADRLEMEGS